MLEALIHNLAPHLPPSILTEIEYLGERWRNGQEDSTRLQAVVDDAIRYLEESSSLAVAPQIVNQEIVRYLNEDEEPEAGFSLLSEPSEEGFYNTHHDVISPIEIYRPDNPLEQKGRLYRPINLANYPDFWFNDTNTLGVDVAGSGTDKSVLINQMGGHVVDIQGYYEQDVTGRVVNNIEEHKPNEVVIDMTGGWGSGIYNQLIALEMDAICTITPVHFNGKPRDEKWNAANARAEMFLILQDLLRLGYITIPPHKELIEEMSWVRYLPHPLDGKFRIEDKKKCKQRNKRSPDHADALALAFYFTNGLQIY